jgi:hypothetical protein
MLSLNLKENRNLIEPPEISDDRSLGQEIKKSQPGILS